jgi:hypothetical protein
MEMNRTFHLQDDDATTHDLSQCQSINDPIVLQKLWLYYNDQTPTLDIHLL